MVVLSLLSILQNILPVVSWDLFQLVVPCFSRFLLLGLVLQAATAKCAFLCVCVCLFCTSPTRSWALLSINKISCMHLMSESHCFHSCSCLLLVPLLPWSVHNGLERLEGRLKRNTAASSIIWLWVWVASMAENPTSLSSVPFNFIRSSKKIVEASEPQPIASNCSKIH